jgi:hypothetical protein
MLNGLLRRFPRPQRQSKLLKELEQMKQRKFHPSGYRVTAKVMSELVPAPSSPSQSRPISYFGSTTAPTPLVSQTPVGSSDFSLGDYIYSQKTDGKLTDPFDTTPSSKSPRLSWRQYYDNFTDITKGVFKDEPPMPEPPMPDSIYPADRPRGLAVVQAQEIFCSNSEESSAPPSIPIPDFSNQLHQRPRIEYLAGLLTFSCLLVTAIQFALTFSPASVDPGADAHYATESWIRKSIGAYFLNLVWVGTYFNFSFPCIRANEDF